MTKPVGNEVDCDTVNQAYLRLEEHVTGYACDTYDRGVPSRGHFHRTIVTQLEERLEQEGRR
jgi:hypothetical protein